MHNECTETIPQFLGKGQSPYPNYQAVQSTYAVEAAPTHHYVSDPRSASPSNRVSYYNSGVNNLNNGIKTSIVQSSFQPVASPLNYGDKVNSSVYQENSLNRVTFTQTTTNQPLTYGSTVRPVDSTAGFHINTVTNLSNQPSAYQPSSTYNHENTSFNLPKFRLLNEASEVAPYRHTTYDKPSSVYTPSEPIDGPRPDLQLEKIRNMLRQDIGDLSSHRTTYQAGY